jgi:hypothetical protein
MNILECWNSHGRKCAKESIPLGADRILDEVTTTEPMLLTK